MTYFPEICWNWYVLLHIICDSTQGNGVDVSQPALGSLKVCYDEDKHPSLPSLYAFRPAIGYFRVENRGGGWSYPSFRCKLGGQNLLLSQPVTATVVYCHRLLLSQPITVTACYCHGRLLSQAVTVTACYCHSLLLSQPVTVTAYYCHSLLLSQSVTMFWFSLREVVFKSVGRPVRRTAASIPRGATQTPGYVKELKLVWSGDFKIQFGFCYFGIPGRLSSKCLCDISVMRCGQWKMENGGSLSAYSYLS